MYLTIGSTKTEKNSRYAYAEKCQGAKYAVIAVHTLAEIFLFSRLMGQYFSTVKPPNFETFAIEWNKHVNGDMIFFKTPELLEKYAGHWKKQEQAKNSRLVHFDVIESLLNEIRSTNSRTTVLPALSPSLPSLPDPIERSTLSSMNLPSINYPH